MHSVFRSVLENVPWFKKMKNYMAHEGSNAKSKKETEELVLKRKAYETLLNRTFLRIIGYTEYYIGYYIFQTQ